MNHQTPRKQTALHLFRAPVCLFSILLLCIAVLPPAHASDAPQGLSEIHRSDLLTLYDPGIPRSVSVEWSYPTGFSLGINGGYQLRLGQDPPPSGGRATVDLFPVTFLMRYSLYETRKISQSIGLGLGPYFYHQGRMPIRLADLDVTGSSIWITEWISQPFENLFVRLKMEYTYAFESMAQSIPLRDFTTWLGLDLHW